MDEASEAFKKSLEPVVKGFVDNVVRAYQQALLSFTLKRMGADPGKATELARSVFFPGGKPASPTEARKKAHDGFTPEQRSEIARRAATTRKRRAAARKAAQTRKENSQAR